MEVDKEMPLNTQARGKRVKATRHFLSDLREYRIHIAEVVGAASFDLMKLERALHPDMVNYPGGMLVVTSTRELSVVADIDVFHEEHECSLRMAGKKPPRPSPKANGRPKQHAAPTKQRQRVMLSATIQARDELPRIEFWSGAVPHPSRTAPRTPPGPPPKAAKAGPARPSAGQQATQPPRCRPIEAAPSVSAAASQPVPMAIGTGGVQHRSQDLADLLRNVDYFVVPSSGAPAVVLSSHLSR